MRRFQKILQEPQRHCSHCGSGRPLLAACLRVERKAACKQDVPGPLG